MGNDNVLRSLEKLAETSMAHLNQEIKKMDWGKKWQTHYPKTERATQETEALKKPEVKEALKEVFNEQSLLLKNLGEVV
ncbi:MAG: hypothetical protein H6626_03085 [Pseudobdellovibrionaceae bacterium]|nr:MAG: hypothetical protein H6626_03085 [Pseudobdellovibrionaceae bacterium]